MRRVETRIGLVALLLAGLVAWTHARPLASPAQAPVFAAAVPLALDGWSGRDAPPLDPDVARVLAADEYVHRYYGRRTDVVETDIAYYVRPQAGAAMHSPLNCLPGNGWQVIESRTIPIDTAQGATKVRRLVIDRKGHRLAMTYWFQNRGAVIASEYRQRFVLLTNGLRGDPTDAALVRVMARDTPQGHDALMRFTRTMIGRLQAAF